MKTFYIGDKVKFTKEFQNRRSEVSDNIIHVVTGITHEPDEPTWIYYVLDKFEDDGFFSPGDYIIPPAYLELVESSLKPERGIIACCSLGYIGLITSDFPQEIEYDDGNTGRAWVGIHLEKEMLGKLWSSRNPKPIMRFDDYVDINTIKNQIKDNL